MRNVILHPGLWEEDEVHFASQFSEDQKVKGIQNAQPIKALNLIHRQTGEANL